MWMVISCDRAFGPCLQGTMRMRQPYNLVNWCEVITCLYGWRSLGTRLVIYTCFVWHQHSNSKQWIKQKEHKEANVDEELELKKCLSKERRGWQGEEDNIENAEEELQLGRFFSSSSCSVFSILFPSPCRPLLSLLGHSSWGLSYNSSQFLYTSILSPITITEFW